MEKTSMKATKISETTVESLKKSSNITQPDELLDKGWSWIIMLSSFGTFFIIGANIFGVGIMHVILLEKYEESVSLTTWAGSLKMAFVSIAGPLSTIVVDRFSCRTAVMISGLLVTAGHLGTAFAPNIQTAIFTLGIVAGGGAGLGYTSSMIVISFNFKKRRGIALGFVLSGMGAGLFALAPVMQIAHDYYGTTGFFIIQAAISLHIVVFGATYFPSALELHIQEKRNNSMTMSNENRFTTILKQYWKLLYNKPILLLCSGMFFNCVGTFLIYLHLPVYVESKGFSKAQASYMLSLTGILSVIGRLLTGLVVNLNKSVDIWLYSSSFAVVSFATIILPHVSNTLAGIIAYAAVLGLFFGSCYVLMTSVNLAFVDMKHISATIGAEFFFGGIGAVLGPELAGLLIDHGGTYEQSISFAGGSLLLAAILSILTVCLFMDSKDNKEKWTWRFQIRRKGKN